MRKIGVNDLYKYLQWLSGKDISGGYISPDEYNLALSVLVPKIVRKYFGNPEEYQINQPSPAISYEISQVVTDYVSALRPTKTLQFNVLGQAIRPPDYLHKSSMGVSWIVLKDDDSEDSNVVAEECCDGTETVQTTKSVKRKRQAEVKWVPVTFVSDNEKFAYLGSRLRQPSKKYPIAIFLDNDLIQVYPTSIKTGMFTYIRYPKPGKWGYTLGNPPVYDPNTSEDIELPEICMDELSVTILDRLGLTIRDPGLVDYARYIKNSGK